MTELTAGLARYLGELWGRDVTVELDGVSSAGARRRNVLFTADDGDEQHRLVATIVPTLAMLTQDFAIEPQAIEVAERHGVPVAHVVGWTTDDSYVDGPCFITVRVDGETVPRRLLRLIEAKELGATVVRQCGEAMAALHAIPPSQAPPGLVRPEHPPAEEALIRLDTAMSTLLQPSPVFSLAYRWLERHLPAPVDDVLVHGDIRTGNIIVGDDGLRALLDWEITRLGDGMEDAAWTCVRMWRFGNDHLEVGGFGHRADLAAAYTAAGGAWDDERFDWWQLLGTARWGVGLSHQAIAHLDGSVPSIVMAASGRRVAEQEFDALTLLRSRLGR